MVRKSKTQKTGLKMAAPTPLNIPKNISETGITIDVARANGIEVAGDGTIINGHLRARVLGLLESKTIGMPATTMLAVDGLRFGQDHPSANGGAANVRDTEREVRIEELVQSIITEGMVLQPLLVWRDTDGDGFDYVVDGSRRLTAVRMINDMLPNSFETVPALLVTGGTAADAMAKSLAANVTQLPLHQVDQFRAFAKVVETLPEGSDPIAAVVSRYGVSPIIAERRLALGQLADEILNDWRAGELDPNCARHYTLIRDKVAQAKLYKKLGPNVSEFTIRRAILGEESQDTPKLLAFVTADAYIAAGGEVFKDLFITTGGQVSDRELLQRMAIEKMDAKLIELTEPNKDGQIKWSWAARADQLPSDWNYTWPKLKLVKGAANYSEHEKSGVVVDIGGDGSFLITYGVVNPLSKKDKVPAGERGDNKKAAAKSSDKPVERGLSANLVHQLQIMATNAMGTAMATQPDLCLTAVVASFLAGGDPLRIRVAGLDTKHGMKLASFDAMMKALLKGGKATAMKGIADLAARSLDFTDGGQFPFEADDGIALLASLIAPKTLNAALRKSFDGALYFESAPKAYLLEAITEAQIASPVTIETEMTKWSRSQLARYAMADNGDGPQILATGWLPKELRGPGYDGPALKPKDKKKVKSSAAKKKGRR